MYVTKIFNAIDSESIEKQVNQFLNSHCNEIEKVININVSDINNSYMICLLYKKYN